MSVPLFLIPESSGSSRQLQVHFTKLPAGVYRGRESEGGGAEPEAPSRHSQVEKNIIDTPNCAYYLLCFKHSVSTPCKKASVFFYILILIPQNVLHGSGVL